MILGPSNLLSENMVETLSDSNDLKQLGEQILVKKNTSRKFSKKTKICKKIKFVKNIIQNK